MEHVLKVELDNWHAMLTDSAKTIGYLLGEVVTSLDAEFGDGYAEKNPQLVGMLVQSSMTSFATSAFLKVGTALLENMMEQP